MLKEKDLACNLASDGTYLYIQDARGLVKLGTGLNGSKKARIYEERPDFPAAPQSSLVCVQGKLYYRSADIEPASFTVLSAETLADEGAIHQDGSGSVSTVDNTEHSGFCCQQVPEEGNKDGICTSKHFQVEGTFYTCSTCSTSPLVCSVCANICHKGHKLMSVSYPKSTCMCGETSYYSTEKSPPCKATQDPLELVGLANTSVVTTEGRYLYVLSEPAPSEAELAEKASYEEFLAEVEAKWREEAIAKGVDVDAMSGKVRAAGFFFFFVFFVKMRSFFFNHPPPFFAPLSPTSPLPDPTFTCCRARTRRVVPASTRTAWPRSRQRV